MAACFCLWLAIGAAAAAEERGVDSGALDAFAPDGARLGSCPLEHTAVEEGELLPAEGAVRPRWHSDLLGLGEYKERPEPSGVKQTRTSC